MRFATSVMWLLNARAALLCESIFLPAVADGPVVTRCDRMSAANDANPSCIR